MRVLLVHEYYRERGGEDVAFETDAELLRDAGHEVECLTIYNSDIRESSPLQRLKLLKATIWSDDVSGRVSEAVARHRPEVVHFHNTFPLVSPAAFPAAKRQGAAVVATLHNYRLLCANASLFREGHICEDCVGSALPVAGVLNACYRGSRSQSAAVAAMLMFHKRRMTWLRDVDRLISPSHFLRSKLIEGGFPASHISVRPNAVLAPTPVQEQAHRDGFLYVGRLATNKGLETLLEAWEHDGSLPSLRIAGSGEMGPRVQAVAEAQPHRVKFLGALPGDEVMVEMQRARALVFPSIWYENQPMTILEAYANGLPVIASRLGAMEELVSDGETGLLFTPGDAADLREKAGWAAAHAGKMAVMGVRAQAEFESRFSPDASLAALVSIYEEVVASRQRVAAL
jgi:glycosyltransferase involved in cell wall biosynthesis